MRVGDRRVHWDAGKWLIFDDTYEHEVRNDSDETRIILLCQVNRPLAAPGSWLAKGLMSYVKRSQFVQEAKDNLEDWEVLMTKAEQEQA